MRTVDLAVYADVLAGEATALACRLERARGRLRQAAIEHEARRSLAAETVRRLERLGLLGSIRERVELEQVGELAAALDAVERLQAWVEAELGAAERRDAAAEADWRAVTESARAAPERAVPAQPSGRLAAVGAPVVATGPPGAVA